ncbi:MAG TPA: hypothetical protein PLL35_00810, partial [Candidatus Cloacimonas sp.]|nr:hypothetical protein [Candidatus Cloacimonas sp.]
VKWVAELRFGKCRQAYFFLKVSDIIGKSEFANPLKDFYHCKMGCRIPIRQMPSSILFFQRSPTLLANRNLPTHNRTSTLVNWVAEFRFGKCRQAYFFLKVSDIIGKSEFANPFFLYLDLLHYYINFA